MKTEISYFSQFPDNFGEEIGKMIDRSMRKKINVQLVGLSGSGKSLIFRSLLAKNSNYYGIDGNLLTENKISDLADKLEEFKQKEESGVVLVDSVEDWVMKKLMSLYDKYRNYVIFVFSLKKEIQMKSSHEVFYLKPWTDSDSKWFLKGLIEDDDAIINNTTIEKIIDASGGVLGIIKRLFELVIQGNHIGDVVQRPWNYKQLNYQLELMINDLGPVGQNDIELLKKYYLVDSSENFLSKVVGNYVMHLSEVKSYLTAEENKAMKFLKKNKGEIVEREDLIVGLWGENATKGISDHALDQLMHRLRNKIASEGVKIETVRGRGYVLR